MAALTQRIEREVELRYVRHAIGADEQEGPSHIVVGHTNFGRDKACKPILLCRAPSDGMNWTACVQPPTAVCSPCARVFRKFYPDYPLPGVEAAAPHVKRGPLFGVIEQAKFWKDLTGREQGLYQDASGWTFEEVIPEAQYYILTTDLETPINEEKFFRRAGGDVICDECGSKYYDHPQHPAFGFLNVICDGSIVKL